MVAVITAEYRPAVRRTVADLREDRKPVLDEIDRQDAATVHLVARHPLSGAELGSLHLVCMADGPPAGDTFACLCDAEVPRGDSISKITRLSVTPGTTATAARDIRMKLAMGIMEYAFANRIERLTMTTRMAELPTLLALGWDIEPLGLSRDFDGETVGALQIMVDAAALARLHRFQEYERGASTVAPAPQSALAA